MISPIIEVENLVKVYPGGTRAVDGISFNVEPGELLGFLGPNGAGKTTTIRILATLLAATSGTARVAGFDVTTQAADVRRRLGLAMQTPTLDAFAIGQHLYRAPAGLATGGQLFGSGQAFAPFLPPAAFESPSESGWCGTPSKSVPRKCAALPARGRAVACL